MGKSILYSTPEEKFYCFVISVRKSSAEAVDNCDVITKDSDQNLYKQQKWHILTHLGLLLVKFCPKSNSLVNIPYIYIESHDKNNLKTKIISEKVSLNFLHGLSEVDNQLFRWFWPIFRDPDPSLGHKNGYFSKNSS